MTGWVVRGSDGKVEKDRVRAGLREAEASDRCAWQRGVCGFYTK